MLKLGHLNQGAVVSTRQKATDSWSSAPITAVAGSQTEVWGNVLPPRYQPDGCALVLSHYWMAVENTVVGSVPRLKNYFAWWESFRSRWAS